MKLKKKTVMLVSFTLGLLLVGTTALADITNKDGYAQLKDGLKVTAESCSSKLESFTMESSMVLKNNGQVLSSENSIDKYDKIRNARESIVDRQDFYNNAYNYYSYRDKTTDINYSSNSNDTYTVVEYVDGRDGNPAEFNNPFAEKEAADVERIIDALVGNLRDQVIVKENPDGSKELSGSLSEVQIPALVNAIVSLQVKQEFRGGTVNGQAKTPELAEDIFVKSISGTASINQDGLMESILGSAVLCGKDSQGNSHELTLDVMMKLKDINATVVTKPDLTGKKVVKETGRKYSPTLEINNPEKFIGPYKNDIIIEKDGKFVKIGERHLTITGVSATSVSGSYQEEYKPGFEQYATDQKDFTFEANISDSKRDGDFTAQTASGTTITGNIYLDEYSAKVNFWFNNSSPGSTFDTSFSPILE